VSKKKEIIKYVNENFEKGYSKEQIKSSLIKYYPEKNIMKVLVERPDPKLFQEYKKFHTSLIVVVVIALILRFYYAYV
jgi:hypothetical protein